MFNQKSRSQIRALLDRLVARDFDSIEAAGQLRRLTRDEIRTALDQYGRTFVPVPDSEINEAARENSVAIDDRRFMVDIDLYTAEEGRSDLTLSLSVAEDEHGSRVSIDDLHVL